MFFFLNKNSRIPISKSEIWCETKMSRRWNYRSLFCEQRIYFVMFISSELISEVFFRPKENYLKGLYGYLNQSEIVVLKMKLQSLYQNYPLQKCQTRHQAWITQLQIQPPIFIHYLPQIQWMALQRTCLTSPLVIGLRQEKSGDEMP